jgi:hypothetical protein
MEVFSWHLPAGTEAKHENSNPVSGDPSEIRPKQFQNVNLERCR